LFPPPEDPAWSSTGRALQDAFRLLALRVESIGLAPEFRERGTGGAVTHSAFFRFGRASEALLAAVASGAGVDSAAAAWRYARSACGEEMAVVRRRLGERGIRVDIVFGMESVARALARMNLLVRIATARADLERSELFFDLLAQLAEGAHEDRSVHDLLSRNLRLLHRRIVDRTGAVGEHYIAEGRREYGLIWLLAAGGGVVAALIAIAKTGIHHLPLPPFLLGLAYGLAYTAGFLLMQRFDLILATKQPAMTAATLAGAMRGRGATARGRSRASRRASRPPRSPPPHRTCCWSASRPTPSRRAGRRCAGTP
jgi:site-specific recombinase